MRQRLPSPQSLRHSWLHRRFGDRIFHPDLWLPTRSSLAMGLAIGWFIGLLPVYGLQIVLALLCGLFLRGHFPTAVLGTFITNPLTTPGILVLQYGFGHWLARMLKVDAAPGADPLLHHGVQLGLGSLASAFAFGIAGYVGINLVWGLRDSRLVRDGFKGLRAPERRT
jgi:uncharacterized protein (DUF2062 family)